MSSPERLLAMNMLAQRQELVIPPLPRAGPDSTETVQYIDELKILRFVGLAKTIKAISYYLPENNAKRERPLLVPPPWFGIYSWRDLVKQRCADWGYAQVQAKDSDEYKITEELTELANVVMPGRNISLDQQLASGRRSGEVIKATILANFSRFRDPALSKDMLIEVARNSFRLPWCLAAETPHAKLAAAQSALRRPDDPQVPWAEEYDPSDVHLDQRQLRLLQGRRIKTKVDFVDLNSLIVRAGYRAFPNDRALQNSMPISRISPGAEPHMGCPITLMPTFMRRDWNMTIDACAHLIDPSIK
jgi:hypothetical protein